MKVLIKGAGDLATGVAQALKRAGMDLLLTEIAQPLAIRRSVALAQAVYDSKVEVEDMQGVLAHDLVQAYQLQAAGQLPVLVDPDLQCLAAYQPAVLVEATLLKRYTGIQRDAAPFVVALGPGFVAGQDVDVVVETMRGHNLGRLIYTGPALPDTGSPGTIAGFSDERLLKANGNGLFKPLRKIGDLVEAGEPLADCGAAEPMRAPIGGCIRGLLQAGLPVHQGMKVGDIDPRPDPNYCWTISDKARALGGAVLVAVMQAKAAGLLK